MSKVNFQFQSVMNAEAHRFNENASKILLGRGTDQIPSLFARLGYECERQRRGDSYRMPCPVCRASRVWISTADPIAYPIYWGCYAPRVAPQGTVKGA